MLVTAVLMVGGAAILVGRPVPASAHSMPTSAVLLDVAADQVTGEVRMPLDRVAFAFGPPALTATSSPANSYPAELRSYTRKHIQVTGGGGSTWSVNIGPVALRSVDGHPTVVMALTAVPPSGRVTAFAFHDDALVAELPTHRIVVVLRRAPGPPVEARELGVLDWNHQALEVPVTGAPTVMASTHTFTTAIRTGFEHVSAGADHLLFLLMLLVPAPLTVRTGRSRRRWGRRWGRRWTHQAPPRRVVLRVLYVVTAFAVGHSLTLALSALGVVHLPVRAVESLVAASVLVSALHALRPVVAGGEAWIAGGFGLVHGLAFAATLSGPGLRGRELVSTLLGFNVGIELTQLTVVALVLPALLLLSRSAAYLVFRPLVAVFGGLLAGGWLLERTTLLRADPFVGVADALVAHSFVVVAALALAAVVATGLPPLLAPLLPARRSSLRPNREPTP